MSLGDRATAIMLEAAPRVFRAATAASSGRVIDMAGDTVPAVFGTATGAVTKQADRTVCGDGENIAARLGGLAGPGAIQVSESIRIAVAAQVAARFEERGQQTNATQLLERRVTDHLAAGYVRTSAPEPGQRADAFCIERIAVAAMINAATTLCNDSPSVTRKRWLSTERPAASNFAR